MELVIIAVLVISGVSYFTMRNFRRNNSVDDLEIEAHHWRQTGSILGVAGLLHISGAFNGESSAADASNTFFPTDLGSGDMGGGAI